MVNTFKQPAKTTTAIKRMESEFDLPKSGWFNLRYTEAKTDLTASYQNLLRAEAKVAAFGKKTVPDHVLAQHAEAARDFNRNFKRLEYAHGKIGATFTNTVKNFASTLGFDIAKWERPVVEGGAKAGWERAKLIKGSMVEKAVAMPLRIMGHVPGLSLLAIGGTAAVIGLGKMHDNAEKETQESMLRQAAEIEAMQRRAIAQAPLAQATTVHAAEGVEPQFPPAGTAMNQAPSQIMAGNDNAQLMGTISRQQAQGQMAAL